MRRGLCLRVGARRPAREPVQTEWSERGDLNSRPPVPQTGALTELRYAPKPCARLASIYTLKPLKQAASGPETYSLAKTRTR